MKSLVCIVLGTVLLFIRSTQGDKARFLVKFDNKQQSYVLNGDVLGDLAKLQQPIRVVAIVGDSRIGKSTTLNLISHFWNGMNGDEVEEIFQTGDTVLAVTRDVWAHIVKPKAMEGSVVLLDVEGTNLGNDSLTDHLSMFTALISSGLTVMVQTVFGNKNLDFLFRVSRLSDVIFRNGSHERFANLRVLFRGHLRPPNGRSLEDYTRDSVVGPFFGVDAYKNEMGRIIAKHFPRDKISVSQVPFIGDPGLFSDNERLHQSDYWKVMKNVAEEFLEFPIKTTFEGTPMDGLALADLAKHLVDTINGNAWPDFRNVYVMFERNICKRHYGNLVKPLLSLKADEITSTMETALNRFKNKCALEGEIKAAEENLKSVAKAKKQLEELDRKRKEAEDKRQEAENKQAEEERRLKAALAEKNKRLAQEKTLRKVAERQRRHLKEQNAKAMKCLKSFKRKLRRNVRGWKKFVGPALIGGLGGLFISDVQLKNNVTVLPLSRYNSVGLSGFSWQWNEIAQEKFGLIGVGQGVIAQDVKKLYPWAAVKGADGFLRVDYASLDAMINFGIVKFG
ncbi:guanylate-binding protein 4-like [Acropora muricata]|uniref:guanylate-binding protein 4-like n=1 Tax=Acropora muricata TaxID=159855 RepID=UPI0034E482C5